MIPIIVALIAVGGTVFTTVWQSRKSRQAVRIARAEDSNEHAMVVQSIADLHADVRQVRDQLSEHISDHELHR